MFKTLAAEWLARRRARQLQRLQFLCDEAELNKLIYEKRTEFARRDLLAYTKALQTIYGDKNELTARSTNPSST